MNLLTIAAREMLVLSRKGGTYGARITLAIPVLLAWMLFALIVQEQGDHALSIQAAVCQITLAFGAAFAASDVIGSERREGTLGLLLLTPLRSYQVLLGKLFSRISELLLCLWAVVPILALPLLAGGVGLSDVAMLFAGILAGCLLGAAIGLCASAIFRRAAASACLSFAALLGCYLLPLIFVWIFWGRASFERVLEYAVQWSPASVINLYAYSRSLETMHWFLAMAVLGGLTLFFLLLSMLLFSFAWITEPNSGTVRPSRKTTSGPHSPRPPIGNPDNPARVLHSRHQRSFLLYRIFTGMLLLPCILMLLLVVPSYFLQYSEHLDYSLGDGSPYIVSLYLLGLPLAALAYYRASLEAPAMIQECRKAGLLELLLISPLDRKLVLSGLSHPAGTHLIWSGFLIFSWHALALAGCIWDAFLGRSFVQSGWWVLHLGCALTLPIELLSIRSAGLWGGLKAKRSLRTSHVIFLIHFVAPVFSWCMITALVDTLWRRSPPYEEGWIVWHLSRFLVSCTIWLVCSIRLRQAFVDGPAIRSLPSCTGLPDREREPFGLASAS